MNCFPYMTTYCVILWLLFKVIIPWLSSVTSDSYRKLDKHQKMIWSENVVSTIHAIVVSLLATWILLYDEAVIKEPVLGDSWSIRQLASIACAFMLVDIVIMYSVGDRSSLFYIHHLSVALTSLYCMREGRFCPWFTSIKTLSEASTPFVHANWFLKASKISEDSVAAKLLTYAVFTMCRILLIPIFWFNTYIHWEKGWSIKIVWVLILSSSVVLDLLNIRWWWQMTVKFLYYARCIIQNVAYDDKRHRLPSTIYNKSEKAEKQMTFMR
ncbi:DgyrCDS4084 [Dimorphilus gyrociliatus]|uniref:DgyrCDS4084 n=1 Tax=Dimorphilus gyrociliatus TaxID=2664684 RepID=A0A7I8VIG7_9ANNE|nr:DgyrCDS4084 [Dimorphilus gyrociliatus]